MAGNVAFMFLCTIMVLGMTPGLGMFYSVAWYGERTP